MIAPLSSKLLSYYNPHRHGSEMLKKLLKPDLLNNVPANAKLAFAVPPPLFRGEARVIVLCLTFKKSNINQPRPSLYPSKIRNVIKGRNLRRLTAARSEQSAATRRLRVGRLSCRLAFLSFPSQDTGRLSTCRKPHRLCFDFRPQCSSLS